MERLRDGVALFADSLPLVHDQNLVYASRGLRERDLQRLVDDIESVQGAAGLRHRKVAFEDEADCRAVERWFRRHGWRLRPLRLMVHRGPVPGEDAVGAGEEIDPARLNAAAHAYAAEEPWGRSPEARRQVVAGDALTRRAVDDERAYGVVVGESVVAYCRLYSLAGVGQIENVTTLAAHRRRGYARGLVSMALRTSLPAHALTFLVAEGADWPRHFYARMGFEDVGGYCEFTRLGG
jgi:GNAT superfamily N-acetyltransferase